MSYWVEVVGGMKKGSEEVEHRGKSPQLDYRRWLQPKQWKHQHKALIQAAVSCYFNLNASWHLYSQCLELFAVWHLAPFVNGKSNFLRLLEKMLTKNTARCNLQHIDAFKAIY